LLPEYVGQASCLPWKLGRLEACPTSLLEFGFTRGFGLLACWCAELVAVAEHGGVGFDEGPGADFVAGGAAEVELHEGAEDVAVDGAEQFGEFLMHGREGDGEGDPAAAEAAAAGLGLNDFGRDFEGLPDFEVEIGLPAEDLRVAGDALGRRVVDEFVAHRIANERQREGTAAVARADDLLRQIAISDFAAVGHLKATVGWIPKDVAVLVNGPSDKFRSKISIRISKSGHLGTHYRAYTRR